MEICFRCEKDEKEVKLLDAIYENDIVKICERCAIVEDIPILRKPTTSQLKEAERNQTVYQRLKKLAGEEKEKRTESILDQIRKLDEYPELEKPEEKKPFNLVDNFHWHVTRARRNKGLSQKQLGWALGESETAVKLIEKGDLPEEPEKLIRKLEQFFQIKLRERTEEEIDEERKKEAEKEEFRIPKAEIEEIEEIRAEPIKPIVEEEVDELKLVEGERAEEGKLEGMQEEEKEKPTPTQILSFKPAIMKDITIADLKEMKEEKEKEERLAAIEEERKKALQAESLIRDLESDEKRKQELRQKVAEEMRDIALGKEETKEEKGKETIEGKRKMLNKAMKKVSKAEEEAGKEVYVPTIAELVEKKKEESMVGDEIELVENEEKVEAE